MVLLELIGQRMALAHTHEARGRCSYDGVLPQSVPVTTKHTGCSRTHTHVHQSQWRKALGTGLERKGGPAQRGSGDAAQRQGRAEMHRSPQKIALVKAMASPGCYAIPQSVPGTTKHTGCSCSRALTHVHQSQWREALSTGLGRKGGPEHSGGGGAAQRPREIHCDRRRRLHLLKQ
jgi:hypothetical protein